MSNNWKDRSFVLAQAVLMVAFITPVNWGFMQSFPIVGLVMVIFGVLVSLIAIWQLRHSISPFPSPKAAARLIAGGVFRWIRHPIYTGILFVTFGYAIYSGSVWKGLLAIALLILFQFKARYEERLLLSKFVPYEAYMAKTGRFLPKLSR